MLQNWFILLPEICLISFFPAAFLVEVFRREKTSKTFYTLAWIFLISTILFSILFYNKSAFPQIWKNTSFSTLFKCISFLFALAWFYLSSKWFLNKNRPSFKFYTICFALLMCFDILISASSLLTLSVVFPSIMLFYRILILRHWDIEKVEYSAKVYSGCAVFFTILLWLGTAIFKYQSNSFEYSYINSFLAQQSDPNFVLHTASLMIIVSMMFIMAVAPFHIWFISFISKGVLPVCGFITLVPPLIYISSLINLMTKCFQPYIEFLSPIIMIFAACSVVIGALSANKANNIRKLFAFVSVYCLGFALLGMENFSSKEQIASFAYLFIAMLSFAGIYTVFLGMKSRGEYLSDMSEITGFYQLRPYMSAALMIFMFSLIGLAPTLGFFGYLSIINNMMMSEQWGISALLFISILFVAGACLHIIRTIYFESLTNKFDRTDKAIYICLFINMVIILVSLLNPTWLIRDVLAILGGVN